MRAGAFDGFAKATALNAGCSQPHDSNSRQYQRNLEHSSIKKRWNNEHMDLRQMHIHPQRRRSTIPVLCYLQCTEASRGCVGTGRGAGRCATATDARDAARAGQRRCSAATEATASFATAARETPPRGSREKKQRLPDSEPSGV